MAGKWIRLLCIVAAGMIAWGGKRPRGGEDAEAQPHHRAGFAAGQGGPKFMFVAQAAALLIISCWPVLSLCPPRFMM